MDNSQHNKIVSFIWSIADDCLRDVFVRGKYRDIILPFTVLRRLDAILVPAKDEVLKANQFLIDNKIDDKYAILPIPVPSIDDQIEIVKKIENELFEIKLAIDICAHEIEVIQEYKTTLISEIVTGKICVNYCN